VPLLKYEVTTAIWRALKISRIKPSDADYDSAYLTLAQAQKAPLVTADKKLYNALKDKFDYLLWVEDF